MASDYSISSAERDGCTVVTIAGEVDLYASPRVRDELRSLIDQSSNDVVVDLRDLSFIDSTGLGVLVGALKRLREKERSLVLEAPNPSIYKIFEITGLTQVFQITK